MVVVVEGRWTCFLLLSSGCSHNYSLPVAGEAFQQQRNAMVYSCLPYHLPSLSFLQSHHYWSCLPTFWHHQIHSVDVQIHCFPNDLWETIWYEKWMPSSTSLQQDFLRLLQLPIPTILHMYRSPAMRYVVDPTNCHVIKTLILSLPLCQSVQHKTTWNVLVLTQPQSILITWTATKSHTTTCGSQTIFIWSSPDLHKKWSDRNLKKLLPMNHNVFMKHVLYYAHNLTCPFWIKIQHIYYWPVFQWPLRRTPSISGNVTLDARDLLHMHEFLGCIKDGEFLDYSLLNKESVPQS